MRIDDRSGLRRCGFHCDAEGTNFPVKSDVLVIMRVCGELALLIWFFLITDFDIVMTSSSKSVSAVGIRQKGYHFFE
jgi:hypothetical protein